MISLNNIKIRTKLSVAVGALCVPLAIMSALFVQTHLSDIGFSQKERTGTAYLHSAWESLSAIYASVEDGTAPSRHIDATASLAEAAKTHNKALGLDVAYDSATQALEGIGFPSQPLTKSDASDAAVKGLNGLITEIANASNLTLDPDLDTFYLQNIVTVDLPNLGGHNNNLYQLLLKASKLKPALADHVAIGAELGMLDDAYQSTANSAAAAVKGTKDQRLDGVLTPQLTKLKVTVDDYRTYSETLQDRLQQGQSIGNDDIAGLLSRHEALETAYDGVWKTSASELDRLLKHRIDGLWASLWTLLTIAGLIAVAALGLALFIAREVSGTLGKMTSAMARLAQDDFDVAIPGNGRKDEIGAMALSVETFKRNGIASKLAFNENLRIKVALDNSSTSVMVADPDGKLVYLNRSVRELMKTAEADLRMELPNFDATRLDGANMDIFHKAPAHQRAMLERLTSTHRAHIKIGNRRFDLIANPVLDSDGIRLGSVVQWTDVTAEKAIEAEVDHVVQAAVAGDFSQRLTLAGKNGFMLNLSQAINRLSENTADSLAEVSAHLGYLSEGDLTRRIEKSYGGLFEELKLKLNETTTRLSDIVEQVVSGAGEVKLATAEITAGTNDLSQRTEQQASSLEETAASMEEMASTIKQNADNAQQASRLASTASEVAGEGGQVVAQAVEAMARIESSSQRISDIVSVIDEIAFQTNLLALNAAVEAARAGDAGRGFAVVATEVRTLAQRSSSAAKDIKGLIAASGSEVRDGVKLVNDAGTALNQIVGSVQKVAVIVSEIAAASKEQSIGVEEINTAVAQMDEMTQQNSALVEENAAASRMLQDQAESMHQRMAFFRVPGMSDSPRAASRTARPMAAAPTNRAQRGRVSGNTALKLQSDLRSALENDDWAEF